MLTPGKVEKGGLYTFSGAWVEQQNEGICWLTNMPNSCSKLKVICAKDYYVLLFETWSPSAYVSTWFITADKNGRCLSEP